MRNPAFVKSNAWIAAHKRGQLNLEHYAAMCGIDAHGKTVKEIRAEFEIKRSPSFSDQHDMKLEEILKQLEQIVIC